MEIKPIAHVENDFPEKFGLPRQGVLGEIRSTLVFDGEYALPEAVRGLEGFGRMWLIWGFSQNKYEKFSPTVRPPKLGGNKKMGVFATRSSFRPNGLGLTNVKIEKIILDDGVRIVFSGGDMADGTPVYDVKPYLPYADAWPDERSGFAGQVEKTEYILMDQEGLLSALPSEKAETLRRVILSDPRPGYKKGGEYGISYAGYNIRFIFEGNKIYVKEITEEDNRR